MRRSSQRDFAVYEFKGEDEGVESVSGRFISRFRKGGSQAAHQRRFTGKASPSCISADSTKTEDSCPSTPHSTDDQPNCSLSDQQSNETQPSDASEASENWGSSPDHAENECLQYPNYLNGTGGDDLNVTVTIAAEYVVCGPKLFAESQLIFLEDRIRIHCTEINGKEFVSEHGISDINRINCQWSESAGTTWVKIWLKSSSGSNDVMVLKFCVPDFDWLEKERKIMLLSPRYETIWNSALDTRLSDDEEELQTNTSRHFLPDFMESTDEVIYPKGDPDAVSLSKRDVELLQPETFINDTIIDFYIKYLTNKLLLKERKRFHFFNSFFFRKLVDLDKNPLSTAEGRSAFLRVRKWTQKVNIFEKDYLFIPVNYNLHWSLLVICHPGEVAHLKEDSVNEASRVPCVLHMDSMKGNHDGLKKLIQSYLSEEWKDRNPTSREDNSLLPKFLSLRFISLELPQQQNAFDCGFFLLHYVELFLKEAPENFNPFVITKFSNFLNADWFIPDEASHKRFMVRNLIYKLFMDSNRTREDELRRASPCEEENPEEQEQGVHACTREGEEEDLCTGESSLRGCTVEDSLERENVCEEEEEAIKDSEEDERGEELACKRMKVMTEET